MARSSAQRGKRRGPPPERRTLVGTHAILEALEHRAHTLRAIFLEDGPSPARAQIREAAEARGIHVERRGREALDELAEGARHQGAVALASRFAYLDLATLLREAPSPALFLALDHITDPHNLGAILRSAVAFGADGILLPERRSAAINPTVARTSAGASELAQVARVPNLQKALTKLADAGFMVVGLDAEGERSIDDLPTSERGLVLVVGAEGSGLGRLVRERCEALVRIPMPGALASLNASVATAIALYEASRQRASKGPPPA